MPYLILLGSILFGLLAFTTLFFAPWVPTKSRDVKRAIKLSGLRSGEVFYDLGCGDGRVTLEAAKTGAKAIGIELFFPLYLVCLVRKWIYDKTKNTSFPTRSGISKKPTIGLDSHFHGNDESTGSITFRCKNLFRQNLEDADVVFLFGTAGPLKDELPKKFKRELKPGARVISYVFPIPDWIPEKVCKGEKSDELSIFVYNMSSQTNLQK